MLLDDDEAFRHALAETLRDDGYEVFDYADPTDVPPSSLQALDRRPVLITDYRMRSGDGMAFADRFHSLHADAPVIVVTSYSTALLESKVAARPYMRLLCKPIDYGTLVAVLE